MSWGEAGGAEIAKTVAQGPRRSCSNFIAEKRHVPTRPHDSATLLAQNGTRQVLGSARNRLARLGTSIALHERMRSSLLARVFSCAVTVLMAVPELVGCGGSEYMLGSSSGAMGATGSSGASSAGASSASGS